MFSQAHTRRLTVQVEFASAEDDQKILGVAVSDELPPLEFRHVAQRLGPDKAKGEMLSGALVTHRKYGTGLIVRVTNGIARRHLFTVAMEFSNSGVRRSTLLDLMNDPGFSTLHPKIEHLAIPEIYQLQLNAERRRRLDAKELETSGFLRDIDVQRFGRLLVALAENVIPNPHGDSDTMTVAEELVQACVQLATLWSLPSDRFRPDHPLIPILARIELGKFPNDAELELIAQHTAPEIAEALYEIRAREIDYANTNELRHIARISSLWRSLRHPELALKATDRVFDANHLPLRSMHPSDEAVLLNTRGAALRETFKLQSARDCARRSMKIRSNNPHAYRMLAAIYHAEGDARARDENFEAAEKLSPVNEWWE